MIASRSYLVVAIVSGVIALLAAVTLIVEPFASEEVSNSERTAEPANTSEESPATESTETSASEEPTTQSTPTPSNENEPRPSEEEARPQQEEYIDAIPQDMVDPNSCEPIPSGVECRSSDDYHLVTVEDYDGSPLCPRIACQGLEPVEPLQEAYIYGGPGGPPVTVAWIVSDSPDLVLHATPKPGGVSDTRESLLEWWGEYFR